MQTAIRRNFLLWFKLQKSKNRGEN